MLTYQTAGESHGKGILAFVSGFPAGVRLDTEAMDRELLRRQGGYGRGGRQNIETDHVQILSGVLHGYSTGSPLTLWVVNRDEKIESMPDLYQPRPGHADLSGSVKYLSGIRPILERASARETAGRVAAGALAALLLREFAVDVVGYVLSVGSCRFDESCSEPTSAEELRKARDESIFYGRSSQSDEKARTLVDQCREEGDTLGGIVEVRAFGVPFGLGSHTQWDLKLDGRLAQAVMSIQGFKGVEIGAGFLAAAMKGSEVHDPIQFNPSGTMNQCGYKRPTNRAGGLEGGMSNSQNIVLRGAMKPIATLKKPLESIDLRTGETTSASWERSDVCAISAASVVMEQVVAFEIARSFLEKFAGDSLTEVRHHYEISHRLVYEKQNSGWK